MRIYRRTGTALLIFTVAMLTAGCQWQGANSLPLPGTKGKDPGAFTVQAQLPDVDNIQRNSRVRVGDVTVGSVTSIERQGWHALVTMTLDPQVELPANATAMVGQTSLLGSKHIELAAPADPQGRLREGSVIPLSSAGAYPTTEKTLAAVSMLLNGGGIGQIHDITAELTTAFAGRESDMRSLMDQTNMAIGHLNDQMTDITSASQSFNDMLTQFSDQQPVLDRAVKTIPDAVAVLAERRGNLTEAIGKFGQVSALASDAVDQTKENFVAELRQLGPVLQSLGDSGRSLTRSLDLLSTFPYPKGDLLNWFRGDYGSADVIFDLTLNRLDSGFMTGTRFEGNLTELELQWGRTIGQLPSPYTARNPLLAPYNFNQGG